MQAYNVNIMQVLNAVQKSNLDIGARTIEVNQVEYFIRGIGYIKNLEDIEKSVVTVKDKIKKISPGLPSKTLDNGTVSKLKIVPFYDRTHLFKETLGALNEALTLEIIITIIVIIIMVFNMRASILISTLIPIAVLMTFIAMRYFKVDANIVALSGIAIAIGTIVDVGIVLSENMIRLLKEDTENRPKIKIIYEATIEVAPAVITAVLTTIVSFIPVFAMEAAEGKLFRPLAFTKTFVLAAALIVAITILPALGHWLFSIKINRKRIRLALNALLVIAGFVLSFISNVWIGTAFILLGALNIVEYFLTKYKKILSYVNFGFVALIITFFLTREWLPLGASNSLFSNFTFVIITIALLLSVFLVLIKYYKRILHWALEHKSLFLITPSILVLWGAIIWLGWNSIFGFIPKGFDLLGVNIRTKSFWSTMHHTFPGTGKEFMPALD